MGKYAWKEEISSSCERVIISSFGSRELGVAACGRVQAEPEFRRFLFRELVIRIKDELVRIEFDCVSKL